MRSAARRIRGQPLIAPRGVAGCAVLLAVGVFAALVARGQEAGGANFLHAHVWPRDQYGAAGFSGLELSSDGRRFVAISDTGLLFRGRIARRDGRITGLGIDSRTRLLNWEGDPLRGFWGDAEGLALAPDGGVHVSYERRHRVLHHAPDGHTTRLPALIGYDAVPRNGGAEALAVDPAGRLWILPEDGARQGRHPIHVFGDGRWQEAGSVPQRGRFRPVGADFGPDGALYLLERQFLGIGFRSQVRRFDRRDDGHWRETVLLTTPLHRHDNLEGIAVWGEPGGAIRITLISDDNGSRLQRTEIVEYRLPLAIEPDLR